MRIRPARQKGLPMRLSKRIRTAAILASVLTVALTSPALAGSTPTPSPTQNEQRPLDTEADRPRPYDPFTFFTPDDCRAPGSGANTTDSQTGGRIVNHFQWCAWQGLHVWLYKDNVLQGSFFHRITLMASASETSRTIDVKFLSDKEGAWKRTDASSTYLRVTATCAGNTSDSRCSFEDQSKDISIIDLARNGLEFQFQSPATPSASNPIAKAAGNLKFTFEYYKGGFFSPSRIFEEDWRCDSSQLTRGDFKNPACIFPIGPVVHLNINDAGITESAQHIRAAQDDPSSTFPVPPQGASKAIPSRLTRHWDTSLRDRQRAKSVATCKNIPGTRPEKTDCDEYPFASTREGSLAGAPAENFNFSVRYINSSDNRRSGCWIQKWYVKDRILEEDTFHVDIFDGPIFPEPPPEPLECTEDDQ
jgi:hypothetical protein